MGLNWNINFILALCKGHIHATWDLSLIPESSTTAFCRRTDCPSDICQLLLQGAAQTVSSAWRFVAWTTCGARISHRWFCKWLFKLWMCQRRQSFSPSWWVALAVQLIATVATHLQLWLSEKCASPSQAANIQEQETQNYYHRGVKTPWPFQSHQQGHQSCKHHEKCWRCNQHFSRSTSPTASSIDLRDCPDPREQ